MQHGNAAGESGRAEEREGGNGRHKDGDVGEQEREVRKKGKEPREG